MNAARLVIVASLALTGWAVAAKPASSPAAPTPQSIVAARQAGMTMSATSLNFIKGASANGMPVKNLAFAAGGLAKWAAAMPALFAESTRAVPSRTRAEAWSNKADFVAKSAAFAEAAKTLAAAAQADDKDAFAAALASTGAACKGCHDSYQTPPQPPKAS